MQYVPDGNYIEELEKVEALAWMFEFPKDSGRTLRFPEKDPLFVSVLENILKALWGYSVIDACKESLGNDPFNYIFMGFPTQGGGVINPEFLDFRETIEEKTLQLVSEMEEAGIIC